MPGRSSIQFTDLNAQRYVGARRRCALNGVNESVALQIGIRYPHPLGSRTYDFPTVVRVNDFHLAARTPPTVYFTGQGVPDIMEITDLPKIGQK